jgi:hypothetical protein
MLQRQVRHAGLQDVRYAAALAAAHGRRHHHAAGERNQQTVRIPAVGKRHVNNPDGSLRGSSASATG